MKKPLLAILFLAFLVPMATAQELAGPTIVIKGDERPAEAEKLVAVWLYPEDYVGKTIKLHSYLFEAENFEYFPEQDGYLFSCEPVVLGRNNAFHSHVGNATFVSQEKLNFFCTTSDGQRIRRLFKQNPQELAINADIVLEVKKRENLYLGIVTSFKANNVTEQDTPAPLPNRRR